MPKLTTVLPSSKDEAAGGWALATTCWTGGGASPVANGKAVAPCWAVGGCQSCAPLMVELASIAECGWDGNSDAVEV